MALVVFLRGVNVGGHRRLRPSLLARQLRRYDLVSIGAAGTLVVRVPPSRARLRAELRRRLPFETEILICRGAELLDLASGDPFEGEPAGSGVVRFVSVLTGRPRLEPPLPLALPPSGRWLLRILARRGRFVLGQYRRHMKVIGYLGTIDRLFGVPVTTRNWNTLLQILRVLEERGSAHTGRG